MKALNLVCAVALVGGCAVDEAEEQVAVDEVAQATTQSNVWQGTWNGGSANGSFYGQLGNGWIEVFEHKTKDFRYAYLHFSTWRVDPSSEECFDWTDWLGNPQQWCWYTRSIYSYGWGSIPEQDAQLNPTSARVRTTLGSNIYGYECVWDWYNWYGSTCSTLQPSGEIALAFTKNGYSSTFQSGTTQQSYGNYTFKSQGSYRTHSASISGNMLGFDVLGGWGNIGDTRGVSISKSIFKTPNQ